MKYTDIPTRGAYIVMVRSRKPLARIIQFGMWLWQFFQAGRRYPRKTYNHADIVVDGFVTGAVGRGVDVRSLKEAYDDGHKRQLKVFMISALTPDLVKVREYLQEHIGKPYEYLNFWHHAMRIFKGKWSGKVGDGANSEFYCIELAAGAMNIVYPEAVKEPWQINPIEFLEVCEDKLHELK